MQSLLVHFFFLLISTGTGTGMVFCLIFVAVYFQTIIFCLIYPLQEGERLTAVVVFEFYFPHLVGQIGKTTKFAGGGGGGLDFWTKYKPPCVSAGKQSAGHQGAEPGAQGGGGEQEGQEVPGPGRPQGQAEGEAGAPG
jgi:hypothetical protein